MCRGTVLFLLGLGLLVSGCGAPQIGTDEKCFKTVDALYTAVTSRNPKLVAQCERLQQLHAQEKLPEAAFRTLTGIIEKACAEKWLPAAEELSEFMKGQRRAKQ